MKWLYPKLKTLARYLEWGYRGGEAAFEPFPTDDEIVCLIKCIPMHFSTTVVFLLAGTTSWIVPWDWSNTNTIECLGSGGGGSSRQSTIRGGNGGGAGGYSKTSNTATNMALGATLTVHIDAAGAGGTTYLQDSTNTNICLANSGTTATPSVAGVGGSTSGAVGGTKFAGGNGKFTTTAAGGGGGGSGGPNGAGGNSASSTGGTADNNTVSGSSQNNNGQSGTEFDGSHGCGSGAGGSSNGTGTDGKIGGAYGGGGSGCAQQSAGYIGGAGGSGLICITYTSVPVSTHVQTVGTDQTTPGSSAAVTLANVTAGDLLEVKVVGTAVGSAPTYTVTDTQGNTYTSAKRQVQGFLATEVYYCSPCKVGTTPTVTVTPNTSATISFSATEYAPRTGYQMTLDAVAGNGGTVATNLTCNGPVFAVAPELMTAVAGTLASAGTITGTGGSWTERYNSGNVVGANDIEAQDQTNAYVTANPTWTTGVAGTYAAVTVGYKITAVVVASGGLLRQSNMDGLGAGGGFFSNPLN